MQLICGIQKRLWRFHIWGRKIAPSSGVKNWFQSMAGSCESGLMLQRAEWLRTCVLGDRETIFVNLDETPVAMQMQSRRAYVCNLIRTLDADWHARIPTRDTRSHATLMTAVCDDALLQEHLPQLLLTKDKTLTRAEKTALRHLPLPIRWLEGSTGWMTSSILKQVFTIYRREIRAVRPNADIVMVSDVASQHVTREVFMHLNRLNLHTLLVPAGMTWLLQPLDTHVFSTPLKEHCMIAKLVVGQVRLWVSCQPAVGSGSQAKPSRTCSFAVTERIASAAMASMRTLFP